MASLPADVIQPLSGSNVSSGGIRQHALTVVILPIESLHPDPRNPRLHSKRQIKQIANSIEAFGFNVPVLIDKDDTLVAGHGRVQACRLLGWTEVPAIRLECQPASNIDHLPAPNSDQWKRPVGGLTSVSM